MESLCLSGSAAAKLILSHNSDHVLIIEKLVKRMLRLCGTKVRHRIFYQIILFVFGDRQKWSCLAGVTNRTSSRLINAFFYFPDEKSR